MSNNWTFLYLTCFHRLCGSMKHFIIFLAFVAVTVPKNNEEHCICGLAKRKNFGKTSETENRIVGGKEAEVNEYPWMVKIISPPIPPYNNPFTCGGSLISDSWILTAAHCILSGDISYANLGEHNTKLKIETRNLTVDSEISFIHPLFSKLRLKFYMEYLIKPLTKLSLVKLP